MRLSVGRKRPWLGIGVVAIAVVTATGAFGASDASTGAAVSAASARCSKAEAIAIVKRLRLGYAVYLPNPVYQVICGAFMGPGSQTMVALLASGGASNPFGGWAVFRLVGGTWQLVTERTGGGRITAAGPDIRETVWVMREGDSRCCPSGGSKARLWRWNGTRFMASAWKQVTPGAAAPAVPGFSGFFKTPSANVVCGYGYGSKIPRAFVGCRIKSGLKPPPRPTRPGCFTTNDVGLGATGRTTTGRTICPGEPEGDAGVLAYENVARVLGYGKTWSGGGLSCASAVTGLTCRNKDGHGFFLSRVHWRAF
jgi:hypothetical protein